VEIFGLVQLRHGRQYLVESMELTSLVQIGIFVKNIAYEVSRNKLYLQKKSSWLKSYIGGI